jgi:hypothetical protein
VGALWGLEKDTKGDNKYAVLTSVYSVATQVRRSSVMMVVVCCATWRLKTAPMVGDRAVKKEIKNLSKAAQDGARPL